jgi:putative NIF3 family GTP cyclohydrolase 1 type 2
VSPECVGSVWRLLGNDINLFAYHLPLDAHPELGNNAQLGRLMGWEPDGRFGEQDLGWTGVLAHPSTLDVLVRGPRRGWGGSL